MADHVLRGDSGDGLRVVMEIGNEEFASNGRSLIGDLIAIRVELGGKIPNAPYHRDGNFTVKLDVATAMAGHPGIHEQFSTERRKGEDALLRRVMKLGQYYDKSKGTRIEVRWSRA